MREKSFKVGKAYKIVWLDHHDFHTASAWVKVNEIPDNNEVRMSSIGVCIKDEKFYVTLAGTEELSSNLQPQDKVYSNIFRCLKSAIQSSKEIKL